jgi:hypothetical protein
LPVKGFPAQHSKFCDRANDMNASVLEVWSLGWHCTADVAWQLLIAAQPRLAPLLSPTNDDGLISTACPNLRGLWRSLCNDYQSCGMRIITTIM